MAENLLIGQGGGTTAVINRTLVALVGAAKRSSRIGNIYAAEYGLQGILDEKFYNMAEQSSHTLDLVNQSVGSAAGSTRLKPGEKECQRVFEVLKKHNIRYFFYIGGNDTAEACNIISNIAMQEGYELSIFHVPKTVDNDLEKSDHAPGYGSAARYIALAVMGNGLDIESLTGIKIDVIMGRNAGWLTLASWLAKDRGDAAPHLAYLPERPVEVEEILSDIGEVYDTYGRAHIAVSEGIVTPDGRPMLFPLMDYLRDNYGFELGLGSLEELIFNKKDSFGNPELSAYSFLGDFLSIAYQARNSKARIRAQTLGTSQRCFMGCVSEADAQEAELVGRMAFEYAMDGVSSGSITLNRAKFGEEFDEVINTGAYVYEAKTGIVPLCEVAGKTRRVPDEYIGEDGKSATEAFIRYATPLVGELPKIGRLERIMV